MKKETGPSSDAAAETGRVLRVMENSELSRRITDLEKSVGDMEKSLTERHLSQITRIFTITASLIGLCAILVGVLSWLARSDTKEAAKDMKAEVSQAVSNMQKRFEILAGESLRKPTLELLQENSPLENRVVELSVSQNIFPKEAPISDLFVKNTGDKRTEPLSIRFSFAAPIMLAHSHQEWETAASFEKDLPSSFYSTRHATVAPGETLNIHALFLDWQNVTPWASGQTNVACKIQVFYGGEKSTEARFQIRVQMK